MDPNTSNSSKFGAQNAEPFPPFPPVGQFGEYDSTGVGTDLTLEWDSTDPDLHAHLREASPASEPANRPAWVVSTSDEEDRYRYFSEAGLPDA